jgi:hypothetical protein
VLASVFGLDGELMETAMGLVVSVRRLSIPNYGEALK